MMENCKPIDEQKTAVDKQIADYEALQLPPLKKELDALVDKKNKAVQEYEKLYKGRKKRWCEQNEKIKLLHTSLKSQFPKWNELVRHCVCPRLDGLAALEADLARRDDAAKGANERIRDATNVALEQAKTYLDTLTANGAKIDAALGTGEKGIADVQKLLCGDAPATAIYPFWFSVLPAHVALAPLKSDLDFAENQSPTNLCGPHVPVGDGERDQDDPETLAVHHGKDKDKPAPAPRPLPWLVDPNEYGHELDCAFERFKTMKVEAAKTQKTYDGWPDDRAASVKRIADRKKALPDLIAECLRKSVPPKPC
ncbi:hypothetical protein [Bradyrhizobium sp. USDA 3315]